MNAAIKPGPKEALSDDERQVRSLYMRLYASRRSDDDFYPDRSCGAEIALLVQQGHAEPHGGGYRLTPAGVVWWCELVLASCPPSDRRNTDYQENVRIGKMATELSEKQQAALKRIADHGATVEEIDGRTARSLIRLGLVEDDEEVLLATDEGLKAADMIPNPAAVPLAPLPRPAVKAAPKKADFPPVGALELEYDLPPARVPPANGAPAKPEEPVEPKRAVRTAAERDADDAAVVARTKLPPLPSRFTGRKPSAPPDAEATGHRCDDCTYRQAVEMLAKKFPELNELVEVLKKAERRLSAE